MGYQGGLSSAAEHSASSSANVWLPGSGPPAANWLGVTPTLTMPWGSGGGSTELLAASVVAVLLLPLLPTLA